MTLELLENLKADTVKLRMPSLKITTNRNLLKCLLQYNSLNELSQLTDQWIHLVQFYLLIAVLFISVITIKQIFVYWYIKEQNQMNQHLILLIIEICGFLLILPSIHILLKHVLRINNQSFNLISSCKYNLCFIYFLSLLLWH